MSGVVFIVCIPCENYEQAVQKEVKKRVTIDDKPKLMSRSKTDEFLSRMVEHEHQGFGKREKAKEQQSMEKILHQILHDLQVKNSTWCKGDKDNYLQVIFSVDSTDRCDEILGILKENQIGQKYDSIVNVLPCTIQYHGPQQQSECFEEQDLDQEDKTTAWHRFLSSVRARLTVAQVVENVKIHATLTFDFIFLILVSTIMCAIGLVENSNVYLLSSMVICPMMGPVMAGTFGSVIQHKKLLTIGVQNELIGLGIATVVGFCYGSLICSITNKYSIQDGNQLWPTYEMMSRGELRSLWVGCLIALLSGAVVALGILSDNIASLVGVAISTSLTPPAVNAGLFWSMATIYYLKGSDFDAKENLTLHNYYSENQIDELLALGAVSLCLTFVNIVCIYAAGIIVFKIKEVAPMSVKDYARSRFWQHDIKIARDYNRTIGNEQGSCMISRLTEELANYQHKHDHMCHSTEITKEDSNINVIKRSQYTWSPCMNFPLHSNIRELSDLYDKLIKGTAHKAAVPKGQRYRRLSQIFERDQDDKLVTISETSHSHISDLSGNSNVAMGKKKFVVTPCKTDPLLQ